MEEVGPTPPPNANQPCQVLGSERWNVGNLTNFPKVTLLVTGGTQPRVGS